MLSGSLVNLFRFIEAIGESEELMQLWLQLMEALWINSSEAVRFFILNKQKATY